MRMIRMSLAQNHSLVHQDGPGSGDRVKCVLGRTEMSLLSLLLVIVIIVLLLSQEGPEVGLAP
jgi:hypothetical protein